MKKNSCTEFCFFSGEINHKQIIKARNEVEISASSLTLLVPPLDKIERAGGAG